MLIIIGDVYKFIVHSLIPHDPWLQLEKGSGEEGLTRANVAGILRDKAMADKLIYIPNDTQNYPFCRL